MKKIFSVMCIMFGLATLMPVANAEVLGFRATTNTGKRVEIVGSDQLFVPASSVSLIVKAEADQSISLEYFKPITSDDKTHLTSTEHPLVTFDGNSVHATEFDLGMLSEGQYVATVKITSGSTTISHQQVTFYADATPPIVGFNQSDLSDIDALSEIVISYASQSGDCPVREGWSKSGKSCKKKADRPIDGCQSGYHLDDGRCKKIVPKPSACPDGKVKVGDVCKSTTYKQAGLICHSGSLSGSQCITQSYYSPSLECPAGYKYLGGAYSCERKVSRNPVKKCPAGTAWTIYGCKNTASGWCPSGYHTNDFGGCFSDAIRVSSDKSCPSGYPYRHGGTKYCFKKSPIKTSLSCPSGYTTHNQQDHRCFSVSSVPEIPSCDSHGGGFTYNSSSGQCEEIRHSSRVYRCHAGGSLRGSTCVTTSSHSASYRCDDGYILEGNKCYETEPPQLQVCPSGSFEISNASCAMKTPTSGVGNCTSGVYNGQKETCLKVVLDYPLLESSETISKLTLSGGKLHQSHDGGWSVIDKTSSKPNADPLLFTSDKAGTPYSITAKIRDAANNETQNTLLFHLTRESVALPNVKGHEVYLPAVAHEFRLTSGDAGLVGIKGIVASLSKQSDVSLKVNGKPLHPGDAVNVDSSFDADLYAGGYSVLLSSVDKVTTGKAQLILSAQDGSGKMLQVGVILWENDIELNAATWAPKQYLDKMDVEIYSGSPSPCGLTDKEDISVAADALTKPTCHIVWKTQPLDGNPQITATTKSGKKALNLTGYATKQGSQALAYNAYIYDDSGYQVKVGEGSKLINVGAPANSIAFNLSGDSDVIYQEISDVVLQAKRKSGLDCTVVTNQDFILGKLKQADYWPGAYCFFEWTSIPDGLSEFKKALQPTLTGRMKNQGDNNVSWRVSIFNKAGQKILLTEESETLSVGEPPLPTIELMTKYKVGKDLYAVPLDERSIGDVLFSSEGSSLDVSIDVAGKVIDHTTQEYGGGRKNKVYRKMNTIPDRLWDKNIYHAVAKYTRVPSAKTESNYNVLTVPSLGISPTIVVDDTEVLDNKPLPVSMVIRDRYNPKQRYRSDTMGDWQGRLVKRTGNDVVPLTAYADLAGGTGDFVMDLADVKDTSMRVYAQAKLSSPESGYSRTELSSVPVLFSVLRGGEIGSSISSRNISGEAPLTTVIKLALDDRLDYRAVGDVSWEVSSDDGATWESSTNERQKFSFVKQFDIGKYKVRAKVTNRNSGLEKYTEELDIIAYRMPTIEVTGPQVVFVGEEATFKAEANIEDGTPDDVVVEWSTDGGETYDESGKTFTLRQEEAGSIKLWVRARSINAEASDLDAHKIHKRRIQWNGFKPPRLYVTGPKTVEVGKTYQYKVTSSLPYIGMKADVEGYFTLPNGETVDNASTVDYTPTKEELEGGKAIIKYTGWVKGFKENGTEATASASARVWQYVWPEFNMTIRTTADVAPAKIDAFVRPVGFRGKLDSPKYDWTLPASAQVTQARDKSQSFVISEPGTYIVSVTITDERGHTRTVEHEVQIETAPEYNIELKFSGSNKYQRAPLDVLLKPYIAGGHPRDRIKTMEYRVDGTALPGTSRYGRTTLDAGEHEVVLRVQSTMGKTKEQSISIAVKENTPPTCSVQKRDSSLSWRLTATCEDTDGRVSKYEWTMDGEPVAMSSKAITISKRDKEVMPIVTLVGIDDAGGRSALVTLE